MWNSINDTTPNEMQLCIVWRSELMYKAPVLARYQEGKFYIMGPTGFIHDIPVETSYWMPAPSEPESK